MGPRELLETFAAFAGLGKSIVDAFADQHPELIAPPHPDTPPEAPVGDVDAEVRAAIERGEL